MKSTALNNTCISGNRRLRRTGTSGAVASAHSLVRHRIAAAYVEAQPAAYIEVPAAVSARSPAEANTGHPRVLHVDPQSGTATVLASLLGSDVHVTHVATLAEARRLLQQQIFSLVILDPALPDADTRSLLAMLPLLADTALLVYSDQQSTWRDARPAPFLLKSSTTARQLWTQMSSMLWNTSAVSAGD